MSSGSVPQIPSQENRAETNDSSPHQVASPTRRKSSIVLSRMSTTPFSPRAEMTDFQETQTPGRRTFAQQRPPQPRRHHTSALDEASHWQGSDRAKLVKKGYRSLAVMCTFVAGVQAQLLQMSYNQTDTASQIVNAFFFAGLFADIAASILAASSARWYEMLLPDEAKHVYDWALDGHQERTDSPESESDNGDEEKGAADTSPPAENGKPLVATSAAPMLEKVDRSEGDCQVLGWSPVERWLAITLNSGLFVALIGLGFLAAGVLVFIWAHTPIVVRTLSTVACVSLALLLPPFFLPHNRARTLRYVKLQRYSGRNYHI